MCLLFVFQISNVSFFIISPVLLYLNNQYVQEHRKPVYYLSGMLLLVGTWQGYGKAQHNPIACRFQWDENGPAEEADSTLG